MQRDDNPDGVPQEVFDDIAAAARTDRYAWFTQFYRDFYNLDETLGTRISEDVVRANWNTATASAPVAAYAVVPSWIEDFRDDIEAVRAAGLPTLILHGTADNILPIDATGRRFRDLVPARRLRRGRGRAARAAVDPRRRRQRGAARVPGLSRWPARSA